MHMLFYLVTFVFFKQKTAYEMRISDWSSDVCSSDLSSAPDFISKAWTPLYAADKRERRVRRRFSSKLERWTVCGSAPPLIQDEKSRMSSAKRLSTAEP